MYIWTMDIHTSRHVLISSSHFHTEKGLSSFSHFKGRLAYVDSLLGLQCKKCTRESSSTATLQSFCSLAHRVDREWQWPPSRVHFIMSVTINLQ
jgi:hypothetical protein